MRTIAYLSLLCLLGVLSYKVKREDVVATLGSSVLLHSEVNPQKQEIIWIFSSSNNAVTILHHIPNYKDWVEPSPQFKSRLHFFRSNGSLMINGLRAGDQGDYSLEVDDHEMKVIHLSLFDNLMEAVILTNSSFLASAIWLICNVSGDPQKYQWWKNGAEISQLHQLRDGNRSLIIMNSSICDCGIYTCVATNPASSIQANHTLVIFGFHQEDVAIIVLSVITSVMYILQCLQYLQHLQCLKLKKDRVASWVKCWRQFLDICTLLTCVTTVVRLYHMGGTCVMFCVCIVMISVVFSTLLQIQDPRKGRWCIWTIDYYWCEAALDPGLVCIYSQEASKQRYCRPITPWASPVLTSFHCMPGQIALYSVKVAVYCTSILQFLTVVLLFAVWWLGDSQKRAAILGWTVAGLHVIMIIISVVFSVLLKNPDYQGCESSFIVWSVFFGAVFVGAVVFLFDFVVQHLFCRKDPADSSASDKHPMSDLERVQLSSFPDDTPSSKCQQSGLSLDDTLDSQLNTESQESCTLELEEKTCAVENKSLDGNNMEYRILQHTSSMLNHLNCLGHRPAPGP